MAANHTLTRRYGDGEGGPNIKQVVEYIEDHPYVNLVSVDRSSICVEGSEMAVHRMAISLIGWKVE